MTAEHWHETSEWEALIHYGNLKRHSAEVIGKVAVAADRQLLADKIRRLPWGHALGDVDLGAVLALLESDQ